MSITKPKRAPRRTAAEWAEIIERHQRSGMTIAAFAAQEGIGAKRLRIWRSRLQRRSIGTKRGIPYRQRPQSGTPRRKQTGSALVPFLPLRLHSNDGSADAIELTLEPGTTVRVTGNLAQRLLDRLLVRL